jgi:salicylate hydroxylase
MAQANLSVAVIGGGIGGLAAALSLLREGFDVHVYEQARALGEVGAGIQMSPNAVRILARFGLSEQAERLGVRPQARHQRRWDDGRTLLHAPLEGVVEEEFGAPYYQFHRADLLGMLARALPPERLHVGHRFTGLLDHGDRVEAQFENGARIVADVLVGADGIHSTVRSTLFGPEEPRFTGCIAYRGLVPIERLRHLDLETNTLLWMGPGGHFVHYFVASRRLLNFVGIAERDAWQRESWTERGAVADALAAFAGWHPQVREIIGAVSETFVWGLFDRAPLPQWTRGRATLLGDACHPMLPFMAQGAAQSIEDGATLAACLSRANGADIPEALRRYQALRLPRTARIQAMSRDNKTRFHLPDGPLQQARDREMASGSANGSIRAMAWIYGHDAGAAA